MKLYCYIIHTKSNQKAFFNLNILNMSPKTEWVPAEW